MIDAKNLQPGHWIITRGQDKLKMSRPKKITKINGPKIHWYQSPPNGTNRQSSWCVAKDIVAILPTLEDAERIHATHETLTDSGLELIRRMAGECWADKYPT